MCATMSIGGVFSADNLPPGTRTGPDGGAHSRGSCRHQQGQLPYPRKAPGGVRQPRESHGGGRKAHGGVQRYRR